MNGFDLLPLGQKMKVIKTNGKEVSHFSYNDEVIVLYRIGDMVVETSIEPGSQKITKICTMDQEHFFRYLPHLGIRSIFNLMVN
jgi:hypothetical protein